MDVFQHIVTIPLASLISKEMTENVSFYLFEKKAITAPISLRFSRTDSSVPLTHEGYLSLQEVREKCSRHRREVDCWDD